MVFWRAGLVCWMAMGGQLVRGQDSVAKADAQLVLGSQALRAGDVLQAVACYTEVTKLRPAFAEGFLNLGIAEQQSGDQTTALLAFRKARSLKPGLRGVNLLLGIAEFQTNQFEKAEADLRAEARVNPKDAKALMWLGVLEMENGRVEAAAKSLDDAAALAPTDADILFHQGRAHLLVSKNSYQKMFAVDPDSYRVHLVLAQADAEADRNEDAIGEYKLAIERAPRNTGLHEALADLYWATGKMDLADSMYEEELALDPHSFTSFYKLGSLRVILGQAQSAVKPLEKAIALKPAFESAFYYLGRAQLDLGQEAQGVANLKRASQAPGDETLNSLAFYQLARAYRRTRQTAEANAALAEFRRLRDSVDAKQKDLRADKIARHGELPRPETLPTNDPAADVPN